MIDEMYIIKTFNVESSDYLILILEGVVDKIF